MDIETFNSIFSDSSDKGTHELPELKIIVGPSGQGPAEILESDNEN